MPFYRIDVGDRQSAWAHMNFGRRKRFAVPCLAPPLEYDDPKLFGGRCGRMSTRLCDGPAGTDLNGDVVTCDMPLCDKHAASGGDDVDYCPRHAQRQEPPTS